MFSDQEREVASNEIAVEARFVDLQSETVAQINPVPDTAARRRRQIAVQRHHPSKNLLLMASAAKPQLMDDLVEIAPLDAAIQDVGAAEACGNRFQEL